MKQSTSFAHVATNQFDYLSSALCANTPPCKKHSSSRKFLTLSISLRLLLVMFVSLTVSAEVLAETITDEITASDLKATSTTYTAFSNVSKSSDAIYAGQSAKDAKGNIQLRSKNSNSGVVSTASGGKVKSVKITVGSGSNTVDVYGSNTAYTSASDLYGDNKGTKIGSLTATGTISFEGDYTYVGIRSNNGAIYLSSIDIVWEVTPSCTNPTISTQPSAATYTKGATATPLKVVASGDDLTYQWYSNTSNSTSGATKINGATNSTYTPSTSTVGTKYYYCIVSSGSCSTTSYIVSVVVKNPTYTVIWKSNGVVIRTDNNVESGTNKTAPTISPIPCGDVIAGWTDATDGNYVHGTSNLYSGATPSIQITGNKTFYAVFADYVNE